MSWRKYFKVVNTSGSSSPMGSVPSSSGFAKDNVAFRNYQSQLPEVYTGHPNRIERYNQYESMDQDSEVNAALDIIAEFSTQSNPVNRTPFSIEFTEDPTNTEIEIIKEQLKNWCELNDINKRIFKIFRNVLKYGDQIFIRDPENFKLFWIDMAKVTKIVVNESDGKEPEQYWIRDINPNFQNLTMTNTFHTDQYTQSTTASAGAYQQPNAPYTTGGTRFQHQFNEMPIHAKHIMHLSMTEGLDVNWPFGISVLEGIFKIYKQKELLEDAILIYRIQRAPERRIFKIDVGDMPSHMAMAFIERVKNEMYQRRIPTQTGGGSNVMDATYNPLSMNEDFFFPVTADGRGSSVETLPGGQNLSEIDDLKYFNNKMFRGLRIPSSYLPTGPEDSTNTVNDGKVGTALIQEYRFNQYCKRLQQRIIDVIDFEFKMFLRWRGINIDNSGFKIEFVEPQNFSKYKETEVDSVRIGNFNQMTPVTFMSKRFILKKYLGLTDEEVQENEKLWAEENDEGKEPDASLRSAGVTSGNISSDMDLAGGAEAGPAPEAGAELGAELGGAEAGGAAPEAGAEPPV